MPEFSDYVIYADESGDHSLERINSDYPVFVLTFCIVRKSDYVNTVVPTVQDFKFRWFGLDIVMVDKKANSSGLQIADLTARPIGLKTIRPDQRNRAYEIIKNKIRRSPSGDIRGWGLKVFP